MELTAKLVSVLPEQTGNGKNGVWRKQDIVVETEGKYPKKVCVSIWGDKVERSVLQQGAQLKISFDIESREFNGRWYTDVKAWKVEPAGGQAGGGYAPAEGYYDSGSPAFDDGDAPF
ncbi:DUF3127 domain-containing protein [Chlorobium sp. N1]|uniref:DUF3127 domain-containing protein n=1 Tax=Chlorobium sp. N1 TaxID=2491138 RepID=UPI0010395DAA|nr:DUF3127 domain-containing protein [Chlorobium sp. N1]TCD46834.1 DUF3127 domain-containing protein [Chlorobium sp. N1]